MNAIGIIPARYASTRLPGKPLADICGKPMIQHVYERAMSSKYLNKVIVATDDERILEAVQNFGGEAVITSRDCTSGSDRVLEIAKNFHADIYVNIQGDEPFLRHENIDMMIEAMLKDAKIRVCTLCYPISVKEARDRNVVKVVRDAFENALYFSRAPIPFQRNESNSEYFGHCGIYAYRKFALETFGALGESFLERTEGLEQLRLLQAGIPIKTLRIESRQLSVDTHNDLLRARKLISNPTLHDNQNFEDGLREIKLILTDVDGVLTDGKLYYSSEGEFLKIFNVRDGAGIRELRALGLEVGIVSGKDSTALRKRLADLDIRIFSLGRREKGAEVHKILNVLGYSSAQALFVGDDASDIAAFKECGIGVCPADAAPEVINAASRALSRKGGEGVLMELAEIFAKEIHDEK